MIQVNDLVKTFDGFRALDAANVTVPQGAIYGLVGPNGAGKTTLLRHLTGVYRPDRGTVRVDGQDVWENPAVKTRIASIPDDWYYFMQASLRDMMRYYQGFYPQFNTERYEKLKSVFSLSETQPIRRMSKGMQKQAAFWLAMCCMPDYLILDEPVDGLDPVMRRQVWGLIMQDVAERGTTVLVSSHNLRELEDVCDHVGIMNKGKVLLERSLSELQDNTVKMQVVFNPDIPNPTDGVTPMPEGLTVLHQSAVGRVHTIIFRGAQHDIEAALAAYQPIFMEAVPLTLEEIFIYELGGADYAVKDIIL
ncbi:MAG: ABC transporter ATP-binding protein [Oscillospiraceae bacterium]|nr:ABC transporter ATP-binding protein [Oscillospiraceae bacterium]